MSRNLRVGRWLAGPFILIVLSVSVFFGHMSGALLALAVAAMPSMYSVDIPTSPNARRYLIAGAMVLLSDAAVVTILVVERSALPPLATIIMGVLVLLGLPGALFDLFLAARPRVRRELYERRRARGWPTTTRI